jgi:hypothetical protein
MTTNIKIKEALTSQLGKEKAVQSQLSQQEQEWQKEVHKVQLETDNTVIRLTQLIENIQEMEQQVDPESASVQQEEIA